MQKVSTLLTADGLIVHAPPINGAKYTVEELQQYVDGYIEILHTPEHLLLIVDEGGYVNDKKQNVVASSIMKCPIFGNVVLCDPSLLE